MIRIDGLIKQYKSITALDGIDLHVRPGELFAYLGPNGAGKTTTIRILTGLTTRTAGNASLNGYDIQSASLDAKRQYGLVPQSINLDRELTVYENLYIHGRLYHMSKKEIDARVDELLGYVEMGDRRKSQVKHLSGGLKRRVMIARALVHAPVILFLDEPTVGLDATIRRRIWALIKKIQKNGTTIFLTTHYIEEAEFLAERVAFIDNGKLVVIDTPQALMERLGVWAMDRVADDRMETVFFESREEAACQDLDDAELHMLRRVNLEDAFIALTGKKVT
jgi:ABC-2 type transport system ATP-binding protein